MSTYHSTNLYVRSTQIICFSGGIDANRLHWQPIITTPTFFHFISGSDG